MLSTYLDAAMHKAHYELLPDGEGFYGSIAELQGVWANADTLEACRTELREALEEWLLLGLRKGHPIPVMDGIDLSIEEVA